MILGIEEQVNQKSKSEIGVFFAKWAALLPKERRKEFMEDIGILALACVESGGEEWRDKIYAEWAKGHAKGT